MEASVQFFVMVNLFVMGLSHLTQPRVWVEYFLWLREKGSVGVFVNGFLSLGFGSIVVAFHSVWSGVPVLVTLYGWVLVLKALFCFTMPGLAMRGLNRVSPERSWQFAVPGAGFLVLSGLLAYRLVTQGAP